MKGGKNILIGVGTVVAGVFVAGLLMNSLRDNKLFRKAIAGYDY